MNESLGTELLKSTQAAACAAAVWTGRGNKDAADQAAVDSMRKTLDLLQICGRVVIGEGERDEAPMLYIGEEVGAGWRHKNQAAPYIDIAVDPLEGTNLCAYAAPGAITVLAAAEKGNLLHAPDTYMNKLAVGPKANEAIDLRKDVAWNVHAIAEAKGCNPNDLTIVVLDRERHQSLIHRIRQTGARVQLIADGDVAAAIATCHPESGIDALMGSGGAPEGVLAAAALRCLGGAFQGQLAYRNDQEKLRAEQMGIHDHTRIYKAYDLAQGSVAFVATGVTSGPLLQGVMQKNGVCTTHSLVLQSDPKLVLRIHAQHDLA